MPPPNAVNAASPRQVALLRNLRNPKEVFRELRNYLAGQFVGSTRDESLLDEILKCLFCKFYIEVGKAEAIPDHVGVFQKSRLIRTIFARVRSDFPDIYDSETEIMLDPKSLGVVLQECDFSLVEASSDPIGDAFEVFVGSESRGRSGQFFTPRTVCEFLVNALDPTPGEKIVDPACGAGGFLTAVTRHFLASGVSVGELSHLTSQTIFGIDKDEYLVTLAKLHVSLLTGGHPQAVCGDSIAMQNGSQSLQDILPSEGFDVLLTNPPFGARIVAASPEVLSRFELARRWREDASGKWVATGMVQSQVPPQVLFVERCLSLLKSGGRMGIVLPESILSNKSYRYLVQFLLDKTDVRGVVGMPDSLFKTSGKGGTHTKTCLLIAQKCDSSSKKIGTVFMAEAKWCGHDSRARQIPKNDIPAISEAFALYRKQKKFAESPLGFVLKKNAIKENVLSPRYYDPKITQDLAALKESHNLYVFRQLVDEGVLAVSTGDELGKLAYGTGRVPFIRTSDISNWELKADPKHGVDHNIYESFRRKQDVRAGDILMVKDGTYLIGTCAIITEADTQLIYQSHLYKIRVHENKYGLNTYLLLAVLSSPAVQRQIRAKQFTQDIIDSLGERLYELVLPIPKPKHRCEEITNLVRRAVQLRIEARELAATARLSVHNGRELE